MRAWLRRNDLIVGWALLVAVVEAGLRLAT